MDKNCRRKDHELRSAIERLRRDLSSFDDCHRIYHCTLKEICAISQSALGFIAEFNLDVSQGQARLKVVSLYVADLAEGEDSDSLLKLPLAIDHQAAALYRIAKGLSAEVIAGSELRTIQQAIGLSNIQQMIVVPLTDGGENYGILCLANGREPYNVQLVKRCWPLLTTATCLRRAVNNQLPATGIMEPPTEDGHHWNEIFSMFEQSAPIGMIELNTNLRVTRFNPEAEAIFGISAQDAMDLEICEFIPERFPNEHRIHTFSRGPATVINQRFLARRQNDKPVPVELRTIRYSRSGQQHFLLMITDSSELNAVKAEQESQTQRFRAVSDLAPVGILQTNTQWEAVYANDRWCEICHLEVDEVISMGWISAIFHEDVAKILEKLRNAIIGGQEFSGQCRFQSPMGDIIWVELHARPLFNSKGDIEGFLATLMDCTYRYQTEQKLRNIAERDALTGLANRAMFQDRLEHALKRTQRHGALVILSLDLDGFKNVNDTLGHDAGDKLLVGVAGRLTGCMRDEDTIARVGGDEFLILIEDIASADIAADLAEKILKHLDQPFNISHQEVYISTSIGITFCVGEANQDSKSLLKQADIALYRAKAEGRNNYQYFSPELEQASKDRLFLGNSLHRALDRCEFQVFYQLQADMDNQIVGSEALLRWQHPERGILPPKEFISLLEETGIIVPVSRWLWHTSFAQHRQWIDAGLIPPNSHISVNLSPRQLRDKKIVGNLQAAISESGLSGNHIIAEITESVLIDESRATIDILQGIRQLGVKIALDDFGTGYSALTHLKKFPIDIIKIDRTFVADLLTDEDDEAITHALISLARTLGLAVVAEGVEDPLILDRLKAWHCDYYQGYLLNRPESWENTQHRFKSHQKHTYKVV